MRLSLRRWEKFWESWVGDSVLCCAAPVTSCMESSLTVLALMSQVEQGLAGLDTAAVYTGAFTLVGTVHSTGEELEQAD